MYRCRLFSISTRSSATAKEQRVSFALWNLTLLVSLYSLNFETVGYIFASDSMGLSSFKFSRWAPKDASFLQYSALRLFKLIQGRLL